MPEKCRVKLHGFDPKLVRGYVQTAGRALWWHISDELYDEYGVKPGDTVSGRLLAIYDSEGNEIAEPNEPFEWKTSKETGHAILLPSEVITKYELDRSYSLELEIHRVVGKPVYPGEEAISRKSLPLTMAGKVFSYLRALYH